MIDDLEILLSDLTTIENKTTSAKNLINTYNLPLEIYEILEAFDVAMQSILSRRAIKDYMLTKYKILFHELLSNNINMFIAIVRSRNDYFGKDACRYITSINMYTKQCTIGYNKINVSCEVCGAYKTLLNYNNFDINFDNLIVAEHCKTTILGYKNDKYVGKFTKSVVN